MYVYNYIQLRMYVRVSDSVQTTPNSLLERRWRVRKYVPICYSHSFSYSCYCCSLLTALEISNAARPERVPDLCRSFDERRAFQIVSISEM